jgi:serine/threonine protein kinase
MGNCSATSPAVVSPSRKPVEAERSEQEAFEANYQQPIMQTAQLDDFQLQRTVGLGAFSRVMSVKHADRLLALKIMSKRAVIETNQVERVLAEKRILQAIHFPFIIQFVYSFKDNANLYLVLDFASGGELFTHFK